MPEKCDRNAAKHATHRVFLLGTGLATKCGSVGLAVSGVFLAASLHLCILATAAAPAGAAAAMAAAVSQNANVKQHLAAPLFATPTTQNICINHVCVALCSSIQCEMPGAPVRRQGAWQGSKPLGTHTLSERVPCPPGVLRAGAQNLMHKYFFA